MTCTGTSGWAASIGINCLGDGGATPTDFALTPDMPAGVIPQKNWNNIPSYLNTPNWGLVQALTDDSGRMTEVSFLYQANDAWKSGGATDTPDGLLMAGILKASAPGYADPAADIPAGTMHLTVSGLPTGTYDLYVYCVENGSGAEGNLKVGSTTYYVNELSSFDGTYVAATSTDPGNPDTTANYCLWKDVPADADGKILIVVVKTDRVNDGYGIAGVQLVKKSSGDFPLNTLVPVATQQPTDTVAVEGGTASFTIGLNGPWAVQWRANGSPIAGATNLTYTTPTLTLADSGKQFDAVVTNNLASLTSAAAKLTVDPKSAPVFTQGFLTVDQFQNIPGSTVQSLFDDPRFPSQPDVIYWATGPDVPQTVPSLDSFGSMVVGWLEPTVTSDYTFFIRSDDSSAFFINATAAASGTNAIPIPNSGVTGADAPVCEEGGCCQSFLEPDPNQGSAWHSGQLAGLGQTTLTPIHLEAGKLYGVCLVYKENSGGDFVQLAWRQAGDTNAAANLTPINMLNTWTMASHAGNRVSITQQPRDVTVTPGASATFTVNARTIPAANQFGIQWMKGGVDILGANGTNYTTPPLQLTDSGTKYGARIIALAGATNSVEASVTVSSSVAPKLSVTRAGTNLTVAWSGTTGSLESATELKATNTVWATVGTQNPVTIPIATGQNHYYRVKQ